MNIQELKNRLINRSKDSLASYSFISKTSTSIIDLKSIEKYFLIDNILQKILVENKLELKIRENLLSEEHIFNLSKNSEFIKDTVEVLKKEHEKECLKDGFLEKSISQWLLEKQSIYKTKLQKIHKNNNDLMKETGIDCLRLGIFYLEGKFPNNNVEDEVFRSPLFFLKAQMSINKTQNLINISINEINLNEIFLEKIAFLHKKKITQETDFQEEIRNVFSKNISDQYVNFIKSILDLIRLKLFDALEISYSWSKNFSFIQLEEFLKPDLRKKEITKFIVQSNNLNIINQGTLGIFKTSSFEIINDLEKWEEIDGDNYLDEMNKNSTVSSLIEYTNKYFEEDEIVQISKLDFSQKNAVANSIQESTVIQGPPGTGKSQTIANLIVNILKNGKNILFSTEKKVATEVVYRNLKIFKHFCLKIHDLEKDKSLFYHQLRENFQFLKKFRGYQDYVESQIKIIDTTINEKFKAINEYKETLDTKKNVLYNKFFQLIKDTRYVKDDIANLANNLIDSNLLKKYNLNKVENINNLFNYLKDNQDIINFYINNSHSKIIINNLENIESLINFNLIKTDIKINEKIITLSNILIDSNLLKKYNLNKVENINNLFNYLKDNQDIINFYNYVKKYNFIFDNLIYRNQLLDFNWKKVLDFKKTIAYFQRTNILKYKIPFYKNFLSKNFYMRINDDEAKETFKYLKNLNKEEKKEWNKLFHTMLNEDAKIVFSQLNMIFETLEDLEDIKCLVEYLYILIYGKNNQIKESELLKQLKPLTKNDEQLGKKLSYFIKDEKYIFNEIISVFEIVNNQEDIRYLVEYLYILIYEKNNSNILNIKIDKLYNEIKDLIKEKTTISEQKLIGSLASKILLKLQNYSSSDSYNQKKLVNFEKRITEGKRYPAIKETIQNYKEIIQIITPVLITSVDVAPVLVPLKRGCVDYTIFDEASQIFLENAIALLYRGKLNIIVGDKKQLSPTNYFNKTIHEEESEFEDDLEDKAYKFNSLLEYTESKFNNIILKYHYRSDSQELIHFSNKIFYNSELIFSNSGPKEIKPIEEIKIQDGVWENRVNEKEAEAVVNLLDDIIKNKQKNETIGVITFNSQQSNLINDKLNELSSPFIESEQKRKEESEQLFIKNLDEVQGDERDIIILAISFARKANGTFSRHFGPINREGGKNRINVAITRAKSKIYVVKSIDSKDIFKGDKGSISEGARIFGEYLEYVELLQKNYSLNSNEVKHLWLRSFNDDSEYNINFEDKAESPLESEIFSALSKALNPSKYYIEQQVEQSGYRIDLAIRDKITKKYILAIECDGFTYHSSVAAKERDYYRQNFLEERGWVFHRISSYDWWKNVDNQIKIINDVSKRVSYLIDSK